jgi:hypothetical protein
VTAIAWSLVGLMAASLGVLAAALFSGLGRIDALTDRIDTLGTGLNSRIDALGTALNSRIDALDNELRTDIRSVRDAVHDLDVRLSRSGG